MGGPIALVHEGDEIVIDAADRADRHRSSTTPSSTSAAPHGQQPEPRYTQGALAKYARAVGSADHGAVTW